MCKQSKKLWHSLPAFDPIVLDSVDIKVLLKYNKSLSKVSNFFEMNTTRVVKI